MLGGYVTEDDAMSEKNEPLTASQKMIERQFLQRGPAILLPMGSTGPALRSCDHRGAF